jgi:hypothetical protein
MSWIGHAAALSDRIATFIDAALGTGPTEDFEALALDIHRWQAKRDPVVRSLVDQPVTRWEHIPAVPVALFKDLPVGTVNPGDEGRVFLTSGTTGSGRGVHRLRSTALYDRGALGWMRACIPGPPSEVIALMTAPTTAPESSLAHMVALFASPSRASWHIRDGDLRVAKLNDAVRRTSKPVFLAATAFAMAEWLSEEVEQLPMGSVVMITGGFKGRVRKLDDTELYTEITRLLMPTRLVTEYGMTELSSQLWGTPSTPYRPPPWLKVLAVDPQTGERLPARMSGQLRFYDLCNLDGTLAIETLDRGIVHDDGTVSLQGRLEGAPARGCSLTVEEAWATP